MLAPIALLTLAAVLAPVAVVLLMTVMLAAILMDLQLLDDPKRGGQGEGWLGRSKRRSD